jgi:PIN domain nuclease of toxin-antitoxin system
VSGYLLDTHIAIIALVEPDRLSSAVRSAILAGPNVGDPRAWWLDALDQLAANPLVLRPDHIAGVYTLPDIHKDPFDRILIAQASVEALEIVTLDAEIPRYASARIRVLC